MTINDLVIQSKRIFDKDMETIVDSNGKLVRSKKMKDTPLTDDEEIIINGDYNRYVYSGFARELERENNRLKKQVVELTEMLIEVRDNPNNNIFEKFEKGVNKI
jgi:hypothetical protein